MPSNSPTDFVPSLPMTTLLRLLFGAASGLAHIHSCGKVHGDIKPSNILLIPVHDGDNITFTAKIADFGFTVGKITYHPIGIR